MGASIPTQAEELPGSWVSSDHEKLAELSPKKKLLVVWIGIIISINVNLGSSLPSGATIAIADHFSVTSSIRLVLLTSIYLLGYCFGPLVFGPLSEHIGRRPVLVGTFIAYLVFTICCAVSPLYNVLLLFRFLAGAAAAAPAAITGPLYADIYHDPERRGDAVAYFTCTGVAAACLGPLVSGYGGGVSWNLPFWIAVAMSGVSLPLVVFLPETYAPVIKKRAMRKAADLAEESPKSRASIVADMKIVLIRPFVMITKEPIVLFTSLYCAYLYAMMFLFFQAYPIIFGGVFKLTPEEIGLTFLPIAAGCLISIVPYFWYCRYHKRASLAGRPWAAVDEYRRLPMACVGGPIIVGTMFWLGWTSYPSLHPAIAASSGLIFGIGYLLIFIAMFNYLNDAYRQYAASAQAAASTTRSLVAVCLPLAAPRMYESLGVQWACSLLAFLALGMAVIPFIFIRYGETVRRKSPIAQRILRSEEAGGREAGVVGSEV